MSPSVRELFSKMMSHPQLSSEAKRDLMNVFFQLHEKQLINAESSQELLRNLIVSRIEADRNSQAQSSKPTCI
jgi:hypothetical protein